MKKIFKCTECGKTFTLDDCELPEPRTINDDTEHERIVCDTCFDNMWDNDYLIHCDNCGIWFENKFIHGETVGDYSFAPCPGCGRDIIDGMTREECLEESRLTEAEENPSFAATLPTMTATMPLISSRRKKSASCLSARGSETSRKTAFTLVRPASIPMKLLS